MRWSVLLIRHGESEVNVADPPVIGGRSRWCELTPAGIAQARQLGRALAQRGEPCDRVIASTAVRAQQTARYCLEALGRPELPLRRLQTASDLEELSQGEWENQPRAEIYTHEVLRRVQEANWHFRPPGGESQDDVFQRAHGWLLREILPRDDRHVWIFCHGLVIKVLLAGLLGLDRRTAWQIPIDHTSLTRLVREDDTWQLAAQNERP